MPVSRGRKQKRPQRPKRSVPPFIASGSEESMVLARSVRRVCEECGSRDLVWGDLAGGVWSARTDGQRGAFTEAVAAGFGNDSIVWWCSVCENLGIFGDSFVSPWG